MDLSQIIGQIFGFVAVVLGIVSYQVKSAKQLLSADADILDMPCAA